MDSFTRPHSTFRRSFTLPSSRTAYEAQHGVRDRHSCKLTRERPSAWRPSGKSATIPRDVKAPQNPLTRLHRVSPRPRAISQEPYLARSPQRSERDEIEHLQRKLDTIRRNTAVKRYYTDISRSQSLSRHGSRSPRRSRSMDRVSTPRGDSYMRWDSFNSAVACSPPRSVSSSSTRRREIRGRRLWCDDGQRERSRSNSQGRPARGGSHPTAHPDDLSVGSRVRRNTKFWKWGDQDGRGSGTVVQVCRDWATVQWDNTGRTNKYRYGFKGAYDVSLVPPEPHHRQWPPLKRPSVTSLAAAAAAAVNASPTCHHFTYFKLKGVLPAMAALFVYIPYNEELHVLSARFTRPGLLRWKGMALDLRHSPQYYGMPFSYTEDETKPSKLSPEDVVSLQFVPKELVPTCELPLVVDRSSASPPHMVPQSQQSQCSVSQTSEPAKYRPPPDLSPDDNGTPPPALHVAYARPLPMDRPVYSPTGSDTPLPKKPSPEPLSESGMCFSSPGSSSLDDSLTAPPPNRMLFSDPPYSN